MHRRTPGEYSANSGPAWLVPGPELSNYLLPILDLAKLTTFWFSSKTNQPNFLTTVHRVKILKVNLVRIKFPIEHLTEKHFCVDLFLLH